MNQGDTVTVALLGKLQVLIWLAGLTPLVLKLYDYNSGGFTRDDLCKWPWWLVGMTAVVTFVLHLAIEDIKLGLAPPPK
jgi:hypothetical protein